MDTALSDGSSGRLAVMWGYGHFQLNHSMGWYKYSME